MADQCIKCSSTDLKGSVYRPTCNTCGFEKENDSIEKKEDVIYMLLPGGAEWEDMILLLNKDEAIEASIKYSKLRVEIFKKEPGKLGYRPTYMSYRKGELVNCG
jgi:hypothetical protein